MTHKTILLVDDEEGIRKVLTISLMDMGFEVLAAENGREGFRRFTEARPPLVLTDIKMPEMDGLELLRRIKAEDPETEVLMITGHGDMEMAIQSIQNDATDFITKPINDTVLENALRRAWERIEMRAEIRDYMQNLERMVDEKTARLIDAERMAAVGETVAGLSHAIKNIAGGLKGGSYVLEKGIELDERKYLLQGWEMVKGNVERITKLSMDLLNYAKTTELRYEQCDPNQPAREVFELLKSRAQENRIEFTADFSENLAAIDIDPDLVHSCLLNIVANAIEACGEEPIGESRKEVEMRTARWDGGVEYRIRDTCGGMEESVQKKLFQGFFTTKGSGGTGIGLMISKKIVNAHGGDIEFDSTVGRGSEFIVRIPGSENSRGKTAEKAAAET